MVIKMEKRKQWCIWKNNGKRKNRINVKLSSNKKDFKMDIQTKFYILKNIWQWFSCNTYKQSYINAEQTWIHWDVYIRFKLDINVRLLLWLQ